MSVAVRYAQAALAVAQAEAAAGKAPLPAFAGAVSALAQAVAHPPVAAALANPRLNAAQRRALATSCAKAVQAPKALQHLLQVLVANGRLALLPAVLAALQAALAKQAGIAEAVVHTARPLTDAQKISLKVQIKAHQKAKDVRLQEVVNPALIGGFRAFFGGLVWDASVQGQLVRLKARLKQAVQV